MSINSVFLIWIIIAILFIAIEIISTSLVAVWFGVGSLAAALMSIYSNNVVNQLLFFLTIGIILTVATRFFAKNTVKYPLKSKELNSLVGSEACATENFGEGKQGYVRVRDIEYLANAKTFISKDDIVVISQVQGSKVIVEKR